jgi:CBS domain-containing protein
MLVEKVFPIALTRLITIQADALLSDAAKVLCETPHKSLVVVCNPVGAMVGVITKTDIVRQIASCQGSSCAIVVATAMTREVTGCHLSDSLSEVLSIMKERGFVHVPIVDKESRPSGVLNARDAFQVLLGEAEYDIALLRDHVMSIGYH